MLIYLVDLYLVDSGSTPDPRMAADEITLAHRRRSLWLLSQNRHPADQSFGGGYTNFEWIFERLEKISGRHGIKLRARADHLIPGTREPYL